MSTDDRRTWSIAAELDTTQSPPTVKDVRVMVFFGNAAYKPHQGYPEHGHGPYAILAQLTGLSPEEASAGIRGIIEHEKALAWIKPFPGVQGFLHRTTNW